MENESKRTILDLSLWVAGLLAGMVLMAHEAIAGGRLAAPPNATWKAECATCHIAYPPQLLPAQAWRRMMAQLDRHFGTDASLGDAKRTELLAYLEAAAGRRKASGTARITEAGWFRKEHAEIAAPTWKSTAVRSSANCEACHQQAATGDFSERNIRITTKEAR